MKILNDNQELLHLDWGFIDETYDPLIIPELIDKALKKCGYGLLQYNDGHGIEELRSLSCDFLLNQFGIKGINLKNTCITNGATAALDLVGRLVLQNKYDSVYFEPVYDTAIESLRINSNQTYGIKIDPLSSPILTREVWRKLENILSNKNTKLFYIVPNFNNPMGITFSLKDRLKIIKLCHKYDVLILEDDPYKLYNFEQISLPENFINLDNDHSNVVYINSISKLTFPGIRIGYVLGNHDIIDKIADIQKYTTSSANLLMQGFAIEAFNSDIVNKSFKYYHEQIKRKKEKILNAIKNIGLDKYIDYTIPTGGFYIWAKIKDKEKDSTRLLSFAKANGVSYVPGAIYFTDNDVRNCLRIAYSQIDLENIEEAVLRLKKTFSKNT